MKIVYWAPHNDRASAIRATEAAGVVVDGDASSWLSDWLDNCSDATVAHIIASKRQLRQALATIWAARSSGKATVFSELPDGDTARAGEVDALLNACMASADVVAALGSDPRAPGGEVPPGRGHAQPARGPILFDLTASIMSRGTPTGIARLEAYLYRALTESLGDRVIPVAWYRGTGTYLRLPPGTRPDTISSEALARLVADGQAIDLTRLTVEPGAQILLTGGTWARYAPFIDALSRVRLRCGAHVTALIHDLAQIKLGHLYPAATTEEFERNARHLARVVDRFLVYSEATRTDLRELLEQADLPFKPVSKFQMGTTLHSTFEGRRDETRIPAGMESVAGRRFALYVSSIEPRKNHRMLLSAWRELVASEGETSPLLLCVGRPLLDGQALVDAVRADEVLARHVHFATGLNDEDLDWCYRNATLTLYPSLYEGWGLPITESLLYGKVCLASDASSMREVAPGLTDLVDPSIASAWAERIAFYFGHPEELADRERQIRARYIPHPWKASAAEVVDIMSTPPSSETPTVSVAPLTRMSFGKGHETSLERDVLRGGWAKPRKAGRSTQGGAAALVFTYLGTQRFALRIWFSSTHHVSAPTPSVDLEGGSVRVAAVKRGSHIDLLIDRSQPFKEIRLLLQAPLGEMVTEIDLGDSSTDLDQFPRPSERARSSLFRRIGRQVMGHLVRPRPSGATA